MYYPFQVDWMYFIAFAAVVIGLVIYSGYVDFEFFLGIFSYYRQGTCKRCC